MQSRRFSLAGGMSLRADDFAPARASPAAAAPVVLLAHGGGQTRHAWGGTARALAARGLRAVAVDLRGHGESDWAADGDYRTERFAADLVDVVEQIDAPVALVGASLGGMAGMLAEGELAPGTFASQVFVDVTPQLTDAGVLAIVGFMRAHLEEGFADLEAAADAIEAYLPERRGRRNPEGLRKNLRLGEDGRWRWHWDPQFMLPRSTDAESATAGPSQQSRLEAAVAQLRCPVLLVRGRLSDLVTPAAVQAFLALVPHAQHVDVADAGHMVAGDRNDAFTDAVVGFLTS